MRKIAITLGLAGGFLLLLMLTFRTHAAPEVPAARHCGDAGPLPLDDPNFCGCTWGEVLFHGRPVPGAAITLTYDGAVVTGVTRLTELELEPYFDLTAHDRGARRGDILTLTARFAGQTVERAFRAWPDDEGEQHVVLAFSERGVWRPWVTGGYTRALALSGDVVWAGGPTGVISVSLSTGVSVTHALPWAEPLVRALAVDAAGHIWAAGDGGVAEFDGHSWHAHTTPPIGTPRALAVDPDTGAVWLGGGDGDGSVAVYTGTWQIAGTFGMPVTALAIDDTGCAWAGTWGEGVYQQDGEDWIHHRAVDGLASDDVLAAVATGGIVWFGTSPSLSGQGPRGGIARYERATGTWRTYTTAHGLPADTGFPQAPASIYALSSGEDGCPWAGTVDGVRFLPEGEDWFPYTATHGLRSGPVLALAAGNGTVIGGVPAGLDRLDRGVVPGNPPAAQIAEVSPLTLTFGAALTLTGEGQDGDEDGAQIVGWDWSSSLDGPLCTSAHCTLPYGLFAPGVHSITLKAQDDEGIWSAPITEAVEVTEAQQVYLPLVLR